MKYLGKVIVKILLFPVALLLIFPAYVGFVLHPEMRRFTFKLER